jgi:hypothetical protein
MYLYLRWPIVFMKHSWTNSLNLSFSLEWKKSLRLYQNVLWNRYHQHAWQHIFYLWWTCFSTDSRHIPIGTHCTPLLADLFLYSYDEDFIQGLLKKNQKKLKLNPPFCRKVSFLTTPHCQFRGLGQGMKLSYLYLWYPLFQALCIINMLDNIFFTFGGHVFQQTVGIYLLVHIVISYPTWLPGAIKASDWLKFLMIFFSDTTWRMELKIVMKYHCKHTLC